jgi:hypothetical protein
MYNIRAYVADYKKSGSSGRVAGTLCVGTQSLYDVPGVILTFQSGKSLIEINIPKELCQEIGSKIQRYAKGLPDEVVKLELL